MPLNLNKCILLRVTKKKSVLNFSCTIDGIQLKESSDVEYLGVTITGCLKWNTHVANVCAAARRALWSLKHKLPFALPSVKLCAYKTLVRPVLESACVAWDPGTPEADKLNKVQRLAVHYIRSRYRRLDSPSDIINSLELESLRARRKTMRLKFLYLIIAH